MPYSFYPDKTDNPEGFILKKSNFNLWLPKERVDNKTKKTTTPKRLNMCIIDTLKGKHL